MLERYDPRYWPVSTESLIHTLIALAVSIAIALALHWAIFAVFRRISRLSSSSLDDAVLRRVRRPLRWVMIGFAISAAAGSDALVGEGWDRAANYLTPALMGWLAYAVVKGFAAGFEAEALSAADPVGQRARLTRISILSRTITVGIVIITVALIMLNIPGVRDIGVTMMASAGLAALAVGAAAQPALKSLIAGLQMAITQPLRIGDLVKMGPDAGRVEEIRMSFVTVRTWDERVLIVPTSRFLDESFENWSRIDERLTGPVFLHLDPAADVGPIRVEFERFVEDHDLWDGRNKTLLMTEAYPESVELRLAVSSATIGDLFALRCAVREHMLEWLRENQPQALIRHRLELPGGHPKAGEPAAP